MAISRSPVVRYPQLINADALMTTWPQLIRALELRDSANRRAFEEDDIVTVDADYPVAAGVSKVLVNAQSHDPVTVTLPKASDNKKREIFVKKIDITSDHVVIQCQPGDTIDGQTSMTIGSQWMTLMIVSNGVNWFVM